MGKRKDPKSQNTRSRKISKWVILVVFVVLAVYLGIGGYTAHVVTQVEEHPQFDKSPGTYGLEYEDIRFTARGDETRLSAWYIPGEEATRVIILVHGRNASKQNAISGNFPKLGAELHDAGFAVLMIDLRAHGESEGKRYSYGVYERRDVLGAVDWLMGQGFSAGKIGVLGISLGGAATIGAAAEENAIGALVVDSTFADINALIPEKFKEESGLPMFFLPGVNFMVQMMYGYNLFDIKPVDEIVKIPPRPILILHCSTDEEVKVSHAYMLKEAVPDAELLVLEGCSHAETFRDFPKEYLDAVIPFFREKWKG